MSQASIPVDLANPGQVFACLGFLESAEVLLGDAKGGFDWRNGQDDVCFRLSSAGDQDPIAHIIEFLCNATVTSLAPINSEKHQTEKWKVGTRVCISHEFPFRPSKKPDTLPAHLEDDAGRYLVIDYWGDTTCRDNVKFWAGAGGYPGAGLARDALKLIRERKKDHIIHDPFALAAEQTSSFRFDWRRDYVPLDVGFSPNEHKKDLVMQGYPIVEILAAIGLSHSRPKRGSTKLQYHYGVVGLTSDNLYEPIFLRAALGALQPPFPGLCFRLFSMSLDWPGQKNQARCITNVVEETSHDN